VLNEVYLQRNRTRATKVQRVRGIIDNDVAD